MSEKWKKYGKQVVSALAFGIMSVIISSVIGKRNEERKTARYKYDWASSRCVGQTLTESNQEIRDFYEANSDCGFQNVLGTLKVIPCNNGDMVKKYKSYAYADKLEDCQQFEIAQASLNADKSYQDIKKDQQKRGVIP